MKIAFMSDIHANLPALESFFLDVEKQKPDAIYCLGDLVGYNVWANEVVQEIRRRRIPTIAGNYDFGVGRTSEDCGCAYKSDFEKDLGKQSIAFTNQIIKDEERNFLRTLPAHIKLEFQLNNDSLYLLMVHGSPRKINEYLFEDRDEKSMLRIMERAGADIMIFGHTHKPYHKIISYQQNDSIAYRHAINLGSIGKPKDGDPRGSYVMITLNEKSSSLDKNSLQIEIKRFDYDVERAAKAIEASMLPNEFANMLREAY